MHLKIVLLAVIAMSACSLALCSANFARGCESDLFLFIFRVVAGTLPAAGRTRHQPDPAEPGGRRQRQPIRPTHARHRPLRRPPVTTIPYCVQAAGAK